MPAHYIIIFVADADVGARLFEVVDEFHSTFYAVLYAFRQRYLSSAEYFFWNEIHAAINEDQAVVAYRAQFGEPLRMLHGYIEYITVKYPSFGVVVEIEHEFINDGEWSHFQAGKSA